jgi:hypothetical protein
VPDPEQRRCYELILKEDLTQFERPMPVMAEYDTPAERQSHGGDPMSQDTAALQQASLRQYCKAVCVSAIGPILWPWAGKRQDLNQLFALNRKLFKAAQRELRSAVDVPL